MVLSGCRTALGKEVRGEGLIGLTRGFQYAGAPRVVASLWRVEDLATAALMARFYRASVDREAAARGGVAGGPALGAPAAALARSLLLGRRSSWKGTGVEEGCDDPRFHTTMFCRRRTKMNIGTISSGSGTSSSRAGSRRLPAGGWILMIGTDSKYGDEPPFLTAEYAVCVGFAAARSRGPDRPVQLSTEDHAGQPAPGAPPHRRTTPLEGLLQADSPLYIYISAAETCTPAGKTYIHLFGSTTYGDPEQMAVWGGSGTPPPPPAPKPGGVAGGAAC